MDSPGNLRNKVALSFINDQVASTHGNIHVDSIFLSPSGEWRLGGFEVLSNPKDENSVLYVRPSGHTTCHFDLLLHTVDTRHIATRPKYLRRAGSQVGWMVCLEEVCNSTTPDMELV